MGACPPAGSPPGQNDSRELSSGGRSRRPQLGNGAAAVASNLPHISDNHASKPKQEKWEKREIVLAPLFSVLLFDLLVRRQRGRGCRIEPPHFSGAHSSKPKQEKTFSAPPFLL